MCVTGIHVITRIWSYTALLRATYPHICGQCDDTNPFGNLATLELSSAEPQAMPDFVLNVLMTQQAKWYIAHKQELGARRRGFGG
jgi:hypothetical protein